MNSCWCLQVSKSFATMVRITLPASTLKQIDEFANEVIRQKERELHHAVDSGHEFKRFHTGLMGECAVEQYFNSKFVDWTIGNSADYNHADLKAAGADVGIKTAEKYNFPVVHKSAYRPEIINIKLTDTEILICGIATIEVLNKYQDDDLIKSEFLKQRGTKTGFYGFNHLIRVDSLEELKKRWPTAGTADQTTTKWKKDISNITETGGFSQ